MTTSRDGARLRDQARRGDGERTDAARQAAEASPGGPSLPERLLAARERKGVDLYRAERDTKIRARYLSALERGDYRELPGTVYTKGFLRNYALYLGLDPDDVLTQWRVERGIVTDDTALVVPRPLVSPRTGLVFSPGVLVAALLTLVVAAFVVYLGFQLFRFAQPPTLQVSDPAAAVTDVAQDTSSYTLRGTSIPGATISIVAAGQGTIRVSADASGHWSQDVPLRRGRNQFDITALDPATDKPSPTQSIFITVPFSIVQAPTLTVDSPADGATFENGAIPVQGTTTDATTVTISAAYLGLPPATGGTPAPPAPSATPAHPAATPAASPSVSSGASPGDGGSGPKPVTVPVGSDGSFSSPFELTAGRWTLTIAASSDQGKTTTLTRTVTVLYKGVLVVVKVQGGPAWIKVWEDGQLDSAVGAAGIVLNNGDTRSFRGTASVEVRTGSSGVTFFTVNGTSVGALGPPGVPQTWLFAPPAAPQQTQHL
ncbi:MAG TPA: helix-turn-helix domain-containing protein [Candidatus Limnocylindrales bacterium]